MAGRSRVRRACYLIDQNSTHYPERLSEIYCCGWCTRVVMLRQCRSHWTSLPRQRGGLGDRYAAPHLRLDYWPAFMEANLCPEPLDALIQHFSRWRSDSAMRRAYYSIRRMRQRAAVEPKPRGRRGWPMQNKASRNASGSFHERRKQTRMRVENACGLVQRSLPFRSRQDIVN